MTGTERSSGNLDIRRRKALFRSWHRGTREMDLVLGRFADAELEVLSDDELTQYEELMEHPDVTLFSWLAQDAPAPKEVETPVFKRIKAFYATGRAVER
ncbi:succinate dehydrogenase assembly factor 2 [Consotaella salsifontis]|uniref:FAD assembly factor SdhE n=1 Tax=Consotaella salsifontis TaxID=1365950 RepID=A0A1T4SYN0_9HYPH|nr:succinate dehydrogenase assembly factor 2 [Consotaella salsifontis]SKA33364.1 antitoxin CptB [Consotaella salsifontis]